MLQRRFTFVRLSDPYLLGVRPRRFDSNAHYRRLLTAAAWSGLKPAPGSRLRRAFLHLPCSLCTVGQFILNLPFRAPAAHSLPDTFRVIGHRQLWAGQALRDMAIYSKTLL